MKICNFFLNENILNKKFNNGILNLNSRSCIKKIFNIIYQYHVRGKKIIFINVPNNIIKNFKKPFKKLNHNFLPSNIWVNGLITNPSTSLYSLIKKKKNNVEMKSFLKLKNKNNLIVNFDNNNTNTEFLIKESVLTLTPLISFNNTNNLSSIKPLHLISSNDFFFLNNKNFIFYYFLRSILKNKINFKKNSYDFKKNFYKKITFNKKKETKRSKNFKYNKIK